MLLVGIVALGLGVMVSIGLRQAANKSQVPARTSLDWESVREGMTKDEVLRILGKPMRIQDYPEAGMTEWWYMEPLENLVEGMQSGGGSLVFEGDRVVKVLTTEVMVERKRH